LAGRVPALKGTSLAVLLGAGIVAASSVGPSDPVGRLITRTSPHVAQVRDPEAHSLTEQGLAPKANANSVGVRLAAGGTPGQAAESLRCVPQGDPDYVPGHRNLPAAPPNGGRASLVGPRCWPEALGSGSFTGRTVLRGRFRLRGVVYR
jgi:hypothetical protein